MDEHLHTDEHQENADTELKIAEPVGYRCQEEKHGSQTQYGKNVGKEHHIGVERHGEYRRYAVEGKDKVAELYHEHRDKERSEQQASGTADEELIALELRVNTSRLGQQSDERMLLHIHLLLLVAVEIHLHAAIYEHRTEDEQYPVETAYYGSAKEYEHETQDDGTEYSPVQHMLIFILPHSEGCENHHHHKEVVYRERLLYQITCSVSS